MATQSRRPRARRQGHRLQEAPAGKIRAASAAIVTSTRWCASARFLTDGKKPSGERVKKDEEETPKPPAAEFDGDKSDEIW